MSHDTFNNFTRVSSEICKTKYISLPPLQVRVQIVCQSQVTRITITTQSLVYGPRSQYLKFSRFDDLFYAQFHISCIRAHLRNNYKKIFQPLSMTVLWSFHHAPSATHDIRDMDNQHWCQIPEMQNSHLRKLARRIVASLEDLGVCSSKSAQTLILSSGRHIQSCYYQRIICCK